MEAGSSSNHGYGEDLNQPSTANFPQSERLKSQSSAPQELGRDTQITEGQPTLASLEVPSHFAVAPRRRVTYRPRSESYPFVESEDSTVTATMHGHLFQESSTFSAHAESPSNPFLEHSPLENSTLSQHQSYASPSDLIVPHLSSASLRAQRNTDSFESPYVLLAQSNDQEAFDAFHASFRGVRRMTSFSGTRQPSRTLRTATLEGASDSNGHDTLAYNGSSVIHTSNHPSLPPPFSATPRSFTSTRCFSQPQHSGGVASATFPVAMASPLTPSPDRRSFSTPSSHLSLPTAPRTPFRIYIDNRSPRTQPQTPADLRPRYLANPFLTAPQVRDRRNAAISPLASQATPARRPVPTILEVPSTPTRPPRRSGRSAGFGDASSALTVSGMDPENQDAVTMEERRWRRMWNAGIGTEPAQR